MKIDELITEEVAKRRLDWTNSPKIGWVLENNTFKLYYGTSQENLHTILKEGIQSEDDGYVTCALEPHTAFAQARIKDRENSAVVVIEMSRSQREKMTRELKESISIVPGCTDLTKDLYEEWAKSDVEFYALAEVFIPVCIPAECIKGYMVK
jgi:hypothetical protein